MSSVKDDTVFLKEMHSETCFIGTLGIGLFPIFQLVYNILTAISKSTVFSDQCPNFYIGDTDTVKL